MKRAVLVSLGILFVVLGVVGVFLPLIPTTFPLLLAAGLFARSSERWHSWLLGHRVFGAYIRNYREGRGMTMRHKASTLVMLWIGIGLSMYLSRSSVAALVVLATVVTGVTIHIVVLPTSLTTPQPESQNAIPGIGTNGDPVRVPGADGSHDSNRSEGSRRTYE